MRELGVENSELLVLSVRPSKRSAGTASSAAAVAAGDGAKSGAAASTDLAVDDQSVVGAARTADNEQQGRQQHASQGPQDRAAGAANAGGAIGSFGVAEAGSNADIAPGVQEPSERGTNLARNSGHSTHKSPPAASKPEVKREKGQRTLQSFFGSRPST